MYKRQIAGDISKVDTRTIPGHDVLLAGFPCQPFSNAGLKKGFQDTRGTAFDDIRRILEFHKPRAFLLENVPGLRSHDNGRTFETIMKILSEKQMSSVLSLLKEAERDGFTYIGK